MPELLYPINPNRDIPWNNIPPLPIREELHQTIEILRILGDAKAALGKLQGRSVVIPNQGLLINTISLQEAKISSEIENIFTTDDELYKAFSDKNNESNGASKEVLRYREALWSGFKYLLFGAMASAIMLYGFSLLYGLTGQTNIYALAKIFALDPAAASPLLYGAAFIVLVGFAFKISAVPMHFWAPDVYEGAPTPIAGFLSTASKAAGFAVLLRVFLAAFPEYAVQWGTLLAVISTITMTLGNMIALAQKNIKRLLAYSSIAHAGYALIGVAVASQLGAASVTYYMIAYLATNLAAFGVVGIYGRIVGSDEISAYAGLSRRSAGLALTMLVAFLSLAGMPPFGGFIAKIFVFAAAVQSGFIWLAVVGVLNSIVGLYYYLTVLKVVYLHRSEGDEVPLTVSRPSAFALGLLVAAILLVGILFTPWFNMASQAALAMF